MQWLYLKLPKFWKLIFPKKNLILASGKELSLAALFYAEGLQEVLSHFFLVRKLCDNGFGAWYTPELVALTPNMPVVPSTSPLLDMPLQPSINLQTNHSQMTVCWHKQGYPVCHSPLIVARVSAGYVVVLKKCDQNVGISGGKSMSSDSMRGWGRKDGP